MAHEELFARLNQSGYKNWLKAGFCLLKVKDGLHEYVDAEMKRFHSNIIDTNPVLGRGQSCRSNCRPKGNQFASFCTLCNEWRKEILKHHTRSGSSAVVNWGNCRPWLWSTEHWEMAKAFMPRGLINVTRAEQCDAAALLNLLNFCDHFSFISQQLVRDVICCRNELMHSCEMQVSDLWMKHFQRSLEQLLLQICHVPAVVTAGRQIQEMLSIDLSLHIPGMDNVDGVEVDGEGPDSISQLEADLLRERLQDLLNSAKEQEPITAESLETLVNLRGFLQDHRDLEEKFRAELHSIQCLQERAQKEKAHEDEDEDLGSSSQLTAVM